MGDVKMLGGETGLADRPVGKGRVVLVVEDGRRLSRSVGYICDYLSLPMERVSTDADLAFILEQRQPMAIVCELDGGAQDGCHIMKVVARHDRDLAVLLVTGNDQAMIGAADAVEEIHALTGVLKLQDAPGLGDVVDFLFHSGRLGTTPYLMAA